MIAPMLSRRATTSASRAAPLALTPLSYRLLSTSASRAKISKVFPNAQEAVKDIKSGSVVVAGGFGPCGSPMTLIQALSKYPEKKDLTLISNNSGVGREGLGTCPFFAATLWLDRFRTWKN